MCLNLPKGMNGYFCKIENNEENKTELIALKKFDKFYYWNHDEDPKPNNAPQRLMKFLKVLNILNGKTENKS